MGPRLKIVAFLDQRNDPDGGHEMRGPNSRYQWGFGSKVAQRNDPDGRTYGQDMK